MQMSVGVLDHYNVSTRKLKETVQFYEDVLGFTNGPRPPFNFPGAWLYSGGHPVLHLNDISQTDRQQRTNFRRHRPRRVRQPRLRGDKAAPHRQGRAAPRKPGAQQHPLADFLRDPNNVEIELNFETKNETAA